MKLHSPVSERIDVRGPDILCAVAADPILAQVIHHDEQDIGLGGGFPSCHWRDDDADPNTP